jgi:hypothetical protein
MSEFTELVDEFKNLKSEIFAQGNFIIVDDPGSDKMKRYNQLLGYFYPQFRTSDYTDPISGVK